MDPTKPINITDLPSSKFKISIKEEAIIEILKDIKMKGSSLYKELVNTKSQKHKKISSIKKIFLQNYKKGKRIPIDCFQLLCKLSNKNPLDYQKYIHELSSNYSQNNWKIKFPIKLNKDLFFISETIRVEGNIIKGNKAPIQGLNLPNKDTLLLKSFEEKLQKLNITKGFSRILTIVAQPKEKIIEKVTNQNNKKLKFKVNKGKLIFSEQVKNYRFQNKYYLHTNKKIHKLKVDISKNNLVTTHSNIKSTAYISLQTYNSVFAKFLNHTFKIPYGIGLNKTYTADFPFNINKLSNQTITAILDTIISCEGNVFYKNNKADRRIGIKMASKKYLEKTQLILNKLGISSELKKAHEENLHILLIRRQNNLKRLHKLIPLTIKYKRDKLKEIINSYSKNRMPHYEATKNYLTILRDSGPTNLKELSQIINKPYETLISAFFRLDKKGLVTKRGRKYTGRGTTPWIYEISNKGLTYLTYE